MHENYLWYNIRKQYNVIYYMKIIYDAIYDVTHDNVWYNTWKWCMDSMALILKYMKEKVIQWIKWGVLGR